MPPLVFCRKSDGSLVPAGAASRIVLKIKLGSVCTAERVPTAEDVRVLSNQKLQSRECTLLRSLLIQNALDNLDQTNKLGLTPPRKLEAYSYDLPEPWTCDEDDEDKENKSSLEDSGVFEMSGSDSEDSSLENEASPTRSAACVNTLCSSVSRSSSSSSCEVVSVSVSIQQQQQQEDKPAAAARVVGKGKPLCLKRKEIQSSRDEPQHPQQLDDADYQLKLASGGKTAKRSRSCGRDDAAPLNFGVQYVSCQ